MNQENKKIVMAGDIPPDILEKIKEEYPEQFKTKTEKIENNKVENNFIKKQEQPEIEINDDDLDRFFQSIINDEPYTEEIKIAKGKMTIFLRSRTLLEIERIISSLSKTETKSQAEFDTNMAKHYMAYSLVRIKTGNKTEEYDKGDLEERLSRINKFNSNKFAIITKILFDFDNKITAMQDKAVQANF